jgi:hypothetical protein
MNVFMIDSSNGMLSAVGTPVPLPYPLLVPISVTVDPLDRFVFVEDQHCHSGCTNETDVWKFDSQTGAFHYQQFGTGVCGGLIRSDPSGEFLYGLGDSSGGICGGLGNIPEIWGFTYWATNGVLTNVPGSPLQSPNGDYPYSDGFAITP